MFKKGRDRDVRPAEEPETVDLRECPLMFTVQALGYGLSSVCLCCISAEDILGIEEEEGPTAGTPPASAYRFNRAKLGTADGVSQSPSGRGRTRGGGGNGEAQNGPKSDGSTTDDEEAHSVTVDEDQHNASSTGVRNATGSLIGEQDPIGDFDRLVARGGDVYSEIIDGSECLFVLPL
jgi:hypothetical protein